MRGLHLTWPQAKVPQREYFVLIQEVLKSVWGLRFFLFFFLGGDAGIKEVAQDIVSPQLQANTFGVFEMRLTLKKYSCILLCKLLYSSQTMLTVVNSNFNGLSYHIAQYHQYFNGQF